MAGEEDARLMLDTLGKMMFACGDGMEPLEKCRMFVAAAVQEQLKQMIQQAMITANQRRCDRIEMIDVVFLFRRHHKQLNRMFQFLQSADLVRMYARDEVAALVDTPSTSSRLAVDDPEDDVVLSEFGKEAQKMYIGIASWDVTGEVRRLLKQSPSDDVKVERIKQMSIRVDAMDSDDYKKFSEARLFSMISSNGKRNERAVLRFIKWLGYPKIVPDTVLLLSYIASEMVYAIVEGAVIARKDEDSAYFVNERPAGCLQVRHYEQSLRKSRGYVERGNILIGYF